MIDWYQFAGYIGVGFYLGSYALLQLGIVRGNGYPYALMNLAAATFVLISLVTGWNLFSAIIQISWITLSVVGIVRVFLLTRGLRFTEEEQMLLDAHFPTMRRIDARTLMHAGTWLDLEAGTKLTEQGSPVDRLIYLAWGGVDIAVDGSVIADVGPGGFIGEMGVMQNAPASATVAVKRPARCFAVQGDTLRRLVKRNPDIGAHLELAFSRNTKASLKATNALLRARVVAG
ncbi:MAG: cyclic nucleotide-binding domain-containing protein [Pseudomonadota bacterium]